MGFFLKTRKKVFPKHLLCPLGNLLIKKDDNLYYTSY